MSKKEKLTKQKIRVLFEGKVYDGTYTLAMDVVTVESIYSGPITTDVSTNPETTARILLLEMLEGAKLRGALK